MRDRETLEQVEARLLREMAARYGAHLRHKRNERTDAVSTAQRKALAATRKEKAG